VRRWALAALLLAGCAAPRAGGPDVPEAPKAPGSVTPAEANFQLLVDEVVLDPAQEGASYTVAWVDGVEKGRTAAGPRGAQKRLLLKLEPGNRPLHLEHSVQPPGGEFAPLPPTRQPRERFVRVEDGYVTRVFLRFGASGPPEMLVQREPKGSFKLLP
jgi:hypothetical protein